MSLRKTGVNTFDDIEMYSRYFSYISVPRLRNEKFCLKKQNFKVPKLYKLTRIYILSLLPLLSTFSIGPKVHNDYYHCSLFLYHNALTFYKVISSTGLYIWVILHTNRTDLKFKIITYNCVIVKRYHFNLRHRLVRW